MQSDLSETSGGGLVSRSSAAATRIAVGNENWSVPRSSSAQYPSQPAPGIQHVIMDTSAERDLDPLQCAVHSLPDRLPAQPEASLPVHPAIVRESQKVERLRSPSSARSTVAFGKPSKLDESGLVGVQFQLEVSETLLQVPQEVFCIVTMLESVGVTHDDHVSARLLRSPFLGNPQIQHVVQVDICQHR